MPDLRGRVLQERDATYVVGSQIEAGLPNITGSARYSYRHGMLFGDEGNFGVTGAFVAGPRQSETPGGGYPYPGNELGFDASRANPIYGNSTTVQPSAYAVRYLIRAQP